MKCYPLDLRNALRDADREGRTGVGFGEAGDPANTVTQGAIPAVASIIERERGNGRTAVRCA